MAITKINKVGHHQAFWVLTKHSKSGIKWQHNHWQELKLSTAVSTCLSKNCSKIPAVLHELNMYPCKYQCSNKYRSLVNHQTKIKRYISNGNSKLECNRQQITHAAIAKQLICIEKAKFHTLLLKYCTACVFNISISSAKGTTRDEMKSPSGKNKAQSVVYSSEHPTSRYNESTHTDR